MIRFLPRFYALAVIAILSITVVSVAPAQRTKPGADNSRRAPNTRLQTGLFGFALDQQDPLFLPAVIYDTGGPTPNAVALADVNGDGMPDLVVADGPNTESGKVGVLLGNGDGTFKAAVAYDASSWDDYNASPQAIAVADVNRDHKPDIIVANKFSWYRFGVLLGNGDGTFQPIAGIEKRSGTDPFSMVVADVNGDGYPDVVEGNPCYSWDDCSTGAVTVSLGNSDGTFQPAIAYHVVSGGLIAVAVADVNGDGRPDVEASICIRGFCLEDGTAAGAAVLLGRGDGTFDPAVTYDSVGNAGWSIAVSDVNRDGKPDLVLASGDNLEGSGGVVGLFLGNGDGTFQPVVSLYPGTGRTRAVAVQDINADGAPDLLVAPYYVFQDPVVVLVGHGDGTFAPTPLKRLYPLEDGTSIVAGDVNGDGRPDLLVTAYPVYGGGLAVQLNNTGPHTPSTTTLSSDANPVAPHQPVTYAAAVTGETGDGLVGTIAFVDGDSTIAEVKVANNQAAYTTSYKWDEHRAHAISAVYSGDLHNAGSTSSTLTEYVGLFPVSSKVQLASSGSPSQVGQPVTFTASVNPASAKYGAIPDGELVWFYDGAKLLGSVALAGGMAQYTTSALSGRSHAIQAKYPGDAIFKPSTGTVMQVVNKYATTTKLSSIPNPSDHGQAVTFRAAVTAAGPRPTGRVKFMDGTAMIGSASLSGGVATLATSKLATGTHPITAQYLGDAANDQSTSPVLNQVVQ